MYAWRVRSLVLLGSLLAACSTPPPAQLVVVSTAPVHDFGRLAVGSTRTLVVTFRNESPVATQLDAFVLESGDAAFRIVDFRGGELPAFGVATAEVSYTAVEGSGRATLLLRHTGGLVRTVVAGIGVVADCTLPGLMQFGDVIIGGEATQTVTFSALPEHSGSAFIGPIVGEGFIASDSGDLELAAGEEKKVTFTFRPTTLKSYAATVMVRVSAFCPDLIVQLSGTGVENLLTCDALDFGYVPPGLSLTKPLMVRNSGLQPLAVTPRGNPDFRLSETSQLVPGTGALIIPVTFAPTLLGPRGADIVLTTTHPQQQRVVCQARGIGGGPDISVSPLVLDFGEVPYFPSQAYGVTRQVKVSNFGSRQPDTKGNLHVTRWVVTPLNGDSPASALCVGAFDETTSTCLDRLAPGYDPAVGIASVLDVPLRVTAPAGGRELEWDVTLFSDDLDEPQTTFRVKARSVRAQPCTYTVTPPSIDFGTIAGQPQERVVTLHNDGATPDDVCIVDQVALTPGGAPVFSLVGGAAGQRKLMAGESMQVVVRITPGVPAPASGALELAVSSPGRPVLTVPLSATAAESCLAFFPHRLTFGTVKEGCTGALRTATAYDGCGGLVVDSWTVRGSQFQVSGLAAGGAPSSLTVKYEPQNPGTHVGVVEVAVQQRSTLVTYALPLSGAANANGVSSETFLEPAGRPRDVLIVMEDSATTLQERFAMHAAKFVPAGGVDARVGVVGSSSATGALVGSPKVLTSSTLNLAGALATRVRQVGNLGFGFKPATAALAALTTDLNVGFLRADAKLAVVVVTDAGDHSTGPHGWLHASLAALKPRGQLTYSVIGPFSGSAPAGCSYREPFPDATLHQFLSSRLDGRAEEVCNTDWPMMLSRVGATAFSTGAPQHLYLEGDPDPSTLVVFRDGMAIPQVHWTWDAARNAVQLDPLVAPGPGETTTVTYGAVCH